MIVEKDGHVTVIIAADPAMCMESVAGWAQTGLIRTVLICARDQLAADQFECFSSIDGWEQMPLTEALKSTPVSSLTVTSLRPRISADHKATPDWPQVELDALREITERYSLASHMPITTMTVSMHDPEAQLNQLAFSPEWDFHLIHDAESVAHNKLPSENVSKWDDKDRLAACALTALMSAGAWLFCEGPITPSVPTGNAVVRWPHVVSPQVRAVFTGQLIQDASVGLVPSLPPWPTPVDTNTKAAEQESVPHAKTATDICHALKFVYSDARQRTSENRTIAASMAAAWRALTRGIKSPTAETDTEQALERLRSNLEDLMHGGTGDVKAAELHRSIQQSEVPGSVGGALSESTDWGSLRNYMFALADGGIPPEGLASRCGLPEDSSGRRLLWRNPSSTVDAPESSIGGKKFSAEKTETAESSSLMSRVREQLLAALKVAVNSCMQHVVPTDGEQSYEAASKSLSVLRKWLVFAASFIALTAVVVAERWLGLLGKVLRSMGLDSIGPQTSQPEAEAVLAGFLMFALLLVVTLTWYWAGKDALDCETAQRERKWSEEAGKHRASEAARLCVAAYEFDHHEKIISVMMHKPYITAQTEIGERTNMDQVGAPYSMLLARAEMNRDKMAEILNRQQITAVKSGWIRAAFEHVADEWQRGYAADVGAHFSPFDSDHTPPGVTGHININNGQEMFGPRESLRNAVVLPNLRKAATEQKVKELISEQSSSNGPIVPFDVLAEAFSEVHVTSAAGLSGRSVAEFLDLSDNEGHELLKWDQILRVGIPKPKVETLHSETPVDVREQGSQTETVIAAWRLFISEAFHPSGLRQYHDSEQVESHLQTASDAVV